MTLFPRDSFLGTFAGFAERGLEFHTEIVVPYNGTLGRRPVQGQFVIVALDGEEEGVLGRITSVQSDGRLTSSIGEDYVARAAVEGREVPEDMRERYLKYKLDVRNLGVLRERPGGGYYFVPSHRRMPHVGAKVGFLPDSALKFVASAQLPDGERAARIGFLALGEFVYAGERDRRAVAGDPHIVTHDRPPDEDEDEDEDPQHERLAGRRLDVQRWMQIASPAVEVTFPITSLISRRAFVFARAGFGKSNLMKLLLAELYAQPPSEKVGGREAPVGTLVFDPEGEYFWPDYRDRAGLADVPALRERLVVFTDRPAPSAAYGSFVAGPVRFDLRQLHASKVAKIAFSAERLEQVNVQALQRLSDGEWSDLVQALHERRHQDARAIVEGAVRELRAATAGVEMIVDAALENAARLVRNLHDPSSCLLDDLHAALAAGRICVVDLSLMRGKTGADLAGIVLDHFFEHNQQEFTSPQSCAIPIIAVIEEAQSVLSADHRSGDAGPFVAWTKEGRKYALGSILVTQQPGSIPFELLSQADNCFAFHLLSEGDLLTLRRANGHFSADLLASLLNEPIPGSGLVWSSVNEKPYPLPVRVLDFQASLPGLLDPERSRAPIETYVDILRCRRDERIAGLRALLDGEQPVDASEQDVLFAAYVAAVDRVYGTSLRAGKPVGFGKVMKVQKEVLLDSDLEDDGRRAFARVRAEQRTIRVIERVAGVRHGAGLEIIDSKKGKAFLVEKAQGAG